MGKREDDIVIAEAKAILHARLHQGAALANNAQAMRDYLSLYLADANRECFGIICLNNTGYVIGNQVLFKGTVDQCKVHSREVVRLALVKYATSVVIYHNHPSGSGTVSKEDRLLTAALKKALELVEIKLADHIIIAGDKTISFHEEGLL